MESDSSTCPGCGGRALDTLSATPHDVPGGKPPLSLLACRACGLAWQHPRYRTIDESVRAQVHNYESQVEGSYFDPLQRREVVATEFSFLREQRPVPGRLLDVGAGDGTFIAHAARNGWRCVGIDPAARLDVVEAPGTAFRLIAGTLDALDSSERFDIITLWDVVEHLDEPSAVIRAALEYLDDDGILVVETGNFHSADRILAGPDWWGYAADHRWYFGPTNLAALLKRAGLQHVALAPRVLRPGWRGTPAYAGPSRRRTIKKLIRAPWAAHRTLAQHLDLRAAATAWPHWAGLGIFCLVASRRPISDAGPGRAPMVVLS